MPQIVVLFTCLNIYPAYLSGRTCSKSACFFFTALKLFFFHNSKTLYLYITTVTMTNKSNILVEEIYSTLCIRQ